MKKTILILIVLISIFSYGKKQPKKLKDTRFEVVGTSVNWVNISNEYIIIDTTDLPVTSLFYSALDETDDVEYSEDGNLKYEYYPRFIIVKQDEEHNVLKQLRITSKKQTTYKIKKIKNKK